MATSLDTFGSHDMFVHGAVMATPGAGLVVLEGRLCKVPSLRRNIRYHDVTFKGVSFRSLAQSTYTNAS